ncbi:hypothetical protein KPL70_007982 [Citrus sinensis]|nr:hypothetical protein KPL70_007982 [Citrus sinensis]
MKMKAVLRKNNCLAAIGERPMEITDDKWNEVDGNAISDLHLALADGVLSSMAEKNTAKEIWDTLTKLYEAKSLHNKIFLKRKLYTLRMAESTMVTDHINTLKTLFSQLTTLGHNIEENERAELLLQSLPDSYDQLIINLTNNNPVAGLVFDDVAASILNEESRRKNKENRQASSQQAEALSVTRGRSTKRGPSGSQNQGRSKSRSKKNVKCYKCGKKGHVKKECWSNQKRKEGKETESSNAQGCVASTSDDGEILYSEATTVSEGRKRLSNVLLIDSGATWHMTSRREWFHTYELISGGSVYMGDDHALEIAGIGTIKIKMFDGTIRTIGEVRHVNGLKKNLLSVGQMDSHGYKTHVENGIMQIVKGALVLMKAEKIGANLFMLKGETLQEADACVASNGEESTMMWHLKLGHMSEQGLKILSEKKLLPGLKSVSLPFCEHCITKAVKTACYLVNRSPSTAIGLKTAMEMWTGKPVDYSYLHAFGCPVYVMYNAQERTKLDAKSRRCIFLGYDDGVKGYRLWDPTAHKIIISRDVIFVEDQLQRKDEDDDTTKEKSETVSALTEDGEPSTFHKALESSDIALWMTAMQEEIEALHKNKTWELVPLPRGRKAIGNKWVYKIKRDGNDQVEQYRARLVVKGYAQKEGIDFNEIFSPVVRLTTVRIVLAMCSTFDLHLEQLDVKTAFLHGELEEEIYMLQPEGFAEIGKENLVCKLNKSLYGFKQAPRCWYKRLDSFIMSLGYNRLSSDHCAYYKRFEDNDFIILLLYVDDMLIAGPNKDRIQELKAQLAREFEMKDLGPANKILGMQIHRDRNNRKIWLSQKNYLKKILRRFNMQDCKSISIPLPVNFKLSSSMCPSNEVERKEMSRVPYASAVGSLMFAMICTRSDIAQAVGAVSRYMANPGGEHWIAVKRIMRYIRGTSDVALCYGGSEFTVRGYVDSNFAGDLDKRKSTTGYVFTLAGAAVSWVSKLQTAVALSTTEAEYMAATQACKEAIWIQRLLEELGHKQQKISVYCDSQSALHIIRNPTFHSRTKHIGVQYHFVREVVEDGSVDLQKIHTKENLADVLTKPINTDKFVWNRSSCGLTETLSSGLGTVECSSGRILEQQNVDRVLEQQQNADRVLEQQNADRIRVLEQQNSDWGGGTWHLDANQWPQTCSSRRDDAHSCSSRSGIDRVRSRQQQSRTSELAATPSSSEHTGRRFLRCGLHWRLVVGHWQRMCVWLCAMCSVSIATTLLEFQATGARRPDDRRLSPETPEATLLEFHTTGVYKMAKKPQAKRNPPDPKREPGTVKISASEHFPGRITNLSKFGNWCDHDNALLRQVARHGSDDNQLWFEFGGANLNELDANFEDLNFNDMEDTNVLKIVLYYFADRVLNRRKDERRPNPSLLNNVDDLQYFRSLSWGRESWNIVYDSLDTALNQKGFPREHSQIP